MIENILFYAICGCSVLAMAVYHRRRRRTFLSVLTGSLTGIAALMLTEKLTRGLDIEIVLSPFNIIGSLILGIPYSVILVIVNFL